MDGAGTAVVSILQVIGLLNNDCKHSVTVFNKEREIVSVTFNDFYSDLLEIATKLTEAGLTENAKVGILAQNSYEWLLYYFAAVHIGSTVIVFPEAFKNEAIDELFEKYSLSLIFLDDTLVDIPSNCSVVDMVSGKIHNVSTLNSSMQNKSPVSQTLVFSSGSTGRLKLIHTSDEGTVACAYNLAKTLELCENDNVLIFLPLSNYQQILQACLCIVGKANFMICRGEELFDALAKYQPTHLLAPPIFYESLKRRLLGNLNEPNVEALHNYKNIAHHFLGGRIKMMITGMAPVKRHTLDFFKLLGLPLYEAYGTIETGPIAINLPHLCRIGSVGKPVNPAAISLSSDGEICYQHNSMLSERYDLDSDNTGTYTKQGFITGDIGYFDSDGFLYLKGRKKFIIITTDGRKTHPEDVEAKINQHPLIEHSVVFGNGLPHLVIVIKLSTLDAEVVKSISTHIENLNNGNEVSVRIGKVHYTDQAFTVENGLLTRNLKIERNAVYRKFQSELASEASKENYTQEYEANSSLSPMELELLKIWEIVIAIRGIGIDNDFFSIGGDSITAIQVASLARQKNIIITPAQIYEYKNIRNLAKYAKHGEVKQFPQEPVTGSHQLLPMQRSFFTSEQAQLKFNQSLSCKCPAGFSTSDAIKIIRAIYNRHDILRARLQVGNTLIYHETSETNVERTVVEVDLRAHTAREHGGLMESIATQYAEDINAGSGLLMKVIHFICGEENSYLHITVHHVAVDGVSWRILLADINRAYAGLLNGPDILLPPKTASFKAWSENLWSLYDREDTQDEQHFWKEIALAPAHSLMSENVESLGRWGDTETVTITLDSAITKVLIADCLRDMKSSINELLLAALYMSLSKVTGGHRFRIDFEGHGRQHDHVSLDVSETVGCFTIAHPILLDSSDPKEFSSVLRSVKDTLRRIPNNGFGFGFLTANQPDQDVHKSEIIFNYLGNLDQIVSRDDYFQINDFSTDVQSHESTTRFHLLEINGMITDNCFKFVFNYDASNLAAAQIDELSNLFRATLYAIGTFGPATKLSLGKFYKNIESDMALGEIEEGEI